MQQLHDQCSSDAIDIGNIYIQKEPTTNDRIVLGSPVTSVPRVALDANPSDADYTAALIDIEADMRFLQSPEAWMDDDCGSDAAEGIERTSGILNGTFPIIPPPIRAKHHCMPPKHPC